MEDDILKKFGHTSNIISKNKVFIFGGANNIHPGNYHTTNDSILFDLDENNWIKLTNEGNTPIDRAAHSSCVIDLNQIIIFGGAQVGGNLCSEILYHGTIINDEKVFWKEIQINGKKPKSRYGHSMVFFKPYLIIFGGSSEKSILNETWILNLKSKDLSWITLENENSHPPKRLYHSSDVCKSGQAYGMIIVFGGRSEFGKTLNDIWGLRQHRNGQWEWIKAPLRDSQYIPQGRFQHKSIFLGSLMFNIGGKLEEYKCNETLDIYDAEINNWISIPFEKIFRHTFWISNGKIYLHGGLDHNNKNVNGKHVKIIEILDIIPNNIDLKEKIIKLSQINNNNISQLSSRSNSVISEKSNEDYIPNIVIHYPNHKPQNLKQNPEIHKVFLKKLLQPQTYINSCANSDFPFSEEQILQLIFNAEEIIKNQPILLNLESPAKIFGDIHGQYSDLMRFFDLWGSPYLADEDTEGDIDNFNYVFLGDYVDRGLHSLETICLLLSLKCMYPNEIHLIRGNHEDRFINNTFGFLEECEDRFDDLDSEMNPESVFNRINDLFEYLPLAAIVDKKILCIHGGIGQTFKSLNQIMELKRPIQVVHEVLNDEHKLIVDILWSDPTDSDDQIGIQQNIMRDPSGTGNIVKFGPDIVNKFLKQNNLIKIIRAHECVMDGIERFAEGKLITVFSATDYCGKHKNAGAVLYLTKDYEINVKLIYPDNLQQMNWNINDQRPGTPPRWKNSPQSNI